MNQENPDNKKEFVKRKSYKKKATAKYKKFKWFLFNKGYHKPGAFINILWLLWDFIKVAAFIGLVVILFYKFLLPKK